MDKFILTMSWKLRCEICKDEFCGNDPYLRSCKICQNIVNKYKNNKKYINDSVRAALEEAYSHKDSKNIYFKCFYTGTIGKFNEKIEIVGFF